MAKKKVFQISNALTEGLEETVHAAHNYTGDLRVETITLKKLDLDPENPRELALTIEDLRNEISKSDPQYLRKSAEKASLFTLANSIKEQGIINPIVVYKYQDKYRLIAGERRTLASILSGRTEIPARILDKKPDELKISLLQWSENIERKDLSLWERIRNLKKILEAFADENHLTFDEITATDLGRLIGCSLPHAMNYITVLHAPKNLEKLIQEDKIKNLEKAALICGIQNESLQYEAIDACLNGQPLKKLKSIAAQQKLAKVSATKQTYVGRSPSVVNLGTTKKLEVAKTIAEAIINHSALQSLKPQFNNLDWSDYKSVNHAFRQLVRSLELLET